MDADGEIDAVPPTRKDGYQKSVYFIKSMTVSFDARDSLSTLHVKTVCVSIDTYHGRYAGS